MTQELLYLTNYIVFFFYYRRANFAQKKRDLEGMRFHVKS